MSENTEILTREIELGDENDNWIRIDAGTSVNVEWLPMEGGLEVWTHDEATDTAYSIFLDDEDYEIFFG